jgi:nucleoside phosphorylase
MVRKPGDTMKILFVASDRMELRGILARASGVASTGLPLDWSRFAQVGSHRALLVANGVGPERAAAAVDAAFPGFEPEAIVSTGFCGALDPQLEIADIAVATSVEGAPVSSVPAPHSGPFRSISHVAHTAEEKRNLAVNGAIAVEMEAAGIAARAQSYATPFYCIRAVTDLAGETLANNFNMALRSDGHFDTILILRGTLRQPSVRLPELIRLRQRCVRAARVLGDFFADCRF